MRVVFISYRSSDAPQVDKIAADLGLLRKPDNTPAYQTWQDKKSIPPASPNWWDSIVDAIIGCDVFVFFLSRASLESEVCRAELEYAHRRNRPIVPVVLDGEFELNPVSGKYDLPKETWALVPAWMTDAQLVFYTGATFIKQFQEAIANFERNWPRNIDWPRPNRPGGTGSTHAIYATACECAGRMAFNEAEKHFREFVMRHDPYYADVSLVWLELMPAYQNLNEMHIHRAPKTVFSKAWEAYVKRFPNEACEEVFDPKQLASFQQTSPQPLSIGEGLKPQEKTPVRDNGEGLKPREQKPTEGQKLTSHAQQTPPLPTERGLGGEVARAREFIRTGTRNADWTPYIVRFDDLKIPDMPFCLVPTGKFRMGNDGEAYYWDGEQSNWIKGVPDGGLQTFEQPFYLAQYPVTNAGWKIAVAAGVVKQPADVGDSLKWYNDPALANAPVVGVNWHEAQKFCDWIGCRLPTEREWEYAARGVDGWFYPWGNEFVADNVVYSKNSDNHPNDVTSRPDGRSWVGACHLSGNVWEWCSTLYKLYPYTEGDGRESLTADGRRVLRGGSLYFDDSYLRAANRLSSSPDFGGPDFGFRCARS